MLVLRNGILGLFVAGLGCLFATSTAHQVEVRLPVWNVGNIISQVAGYVNGQGSTKRKRTRTQKKEYSPYGYYGPPPLIHFPPLVPYFPYYPLYPPIKIPPPTEPPTDPPTDPPTKPPTEPPTDPPTDPPTKPPTEPPTDPPTDPPTKPPTEPPTDPPTTPPTKPPTEPPTDPPSTTIPPWPTKPNDEVFGSDPSICILYPYLTACQVLKKTSYNVAKNPPKLSIVSKPHSVTSICDHYPKFCRKPEEAQFLKLSDSNGKPWLLISGLPEA